MRTESGSGRLRGRKRAGSCGQTLVELALVTPLLVAMVFGAIELGRYAYLSILVADAAHAGALYGSQSYITAGNALGIVNAADNDYINNGQKVSTLTVSSYQSCGCENAGTFTVVATTQTNPAACSTNASAGGGIDPLTVCGSATSDQTKWTVTVTVTASATFHSLFSYPFIPSSLAIAKTATMRVTPK